jgi:histidinol phosphatase-like PHP family hydrolase
MGIGVGGLSNGQIAELLALEADKVQGQVRLAFRRAARLSYIWPVEVGDLIKRGESLTLLPGVGRPGERRTRAICRYTPPGATGAGTVHEMADAALDLGYACIGISEGHLDRQRIEIEAVNEDLRARSFRVLQGGRIEPQSSRGRGHEPESVGQARFVVGSFHSALRRTEDQTERYIAALENPDIQILGHPRGRIYNHREGLRADWTRVFARAAQLDKAVEIDAYPDRQDLNVNLLEIAKREGVRIAIDTDAHTPAQLSFVELGLAAAIRAGIAKDRVINFLSVPALLNWIEQLRSRSRSRRAAFVLEPDLAETT